MVGVPTENDVRTTILALPQLSVWPELAELFAPRGGPVRLDWQLPFLACYAVGGDAACALPAMAAVACLQISIILADDILDQDPRGKHHRLGVGRTTNLALALQAAGYAILDDAPAPASARAAACAALMRAALATAAGQELDVQNLQGEAAYWRVIEAKSTPFYGCALAVGGWLSGAPEGTCLALHSLGVLLGEITQFYDDLFDAFETPPNPDWREGRNNLTLLYASTADHPLKDRFIALRPDVSEPERLAEAQSILVSSGAVSYCVYQIVERYRRAVRTLGALTLSDPEPLASLFESQVSRLRQWLPTIGLDAFPELAPEAA